MGIRLLLFFSIVLIACQKGFMESLDECDALPLKEENPFLKFYGIQEDRRWISGVLTQFKYQHFGRPIPTPLPELDLCHVKDFKHIKGVFLQKVETCFTQLQNGNEKCYDSAKDFTDLQLFIEFLFDIDEEAVVWNRYQKEGEWIKKKFKEEYLNDELKTLNQELKIESILIIQEIPGRLQKEFEMMRDGTNPSEFIAYHNENTAKMQRLMRTLNSAPANLRYGHRATNKKISCRLDPMGNNFQLQTGNEYQRFTRKENQWMVPSGKYKGKWCSEPLKVNEDDINEGEGFYVYSSNGNKDCVSEASNCVLNYVQNRNSLLCSNTGGG